MWLLRRSTQVAFFLLFTILILKTAYPLRTPLPPESLLRIDPLAAVSVWLANKSLVTKLLPAMGLIVLIALLGRVFCGWLCPMGSLIDLSDKCFFPKTKRWGSGKYGFRKLKFYLLIFILITSTFTLGLMGLFDPLSIFVRSFVITLIPSLGHLVNAFLDLIRPLLRMAGPESWGVVELKHRFYSLNLLTFLVLVTILALGILQHRFWCRNLCPLGALFGLFSRFSLLGRRTGDRCTQCLTCQKGCSMGTIEQPNLYSKSDCIVCLRCLENCPQRNISFKTRPLPLGSGMSHDPSRRQVLTSVGLSIVAVGVFKSSWMKKTKNTNVIRPPGSLAEEEFIGSCIKCGECIKVCLTNVLQPTFLEAGIEGIWTPRLIPRRRKSPEPRGCPKYCNLCTRVCPTDAIGYLDLEEKQKFRIGLANLYQDRCLAWAWNTPCLVCYDYCPYYAVRLDEVRGLKRPSVVHEKCIGCGVCESMCPIEGSAIIVTAQRETRLGGARL